MYIPVKSAKPLEGHKLQIKFKNGEEKVFDLTPYLTIGKFAELRDVNLFNSVTVKFDSIEWANHLDIDPEFLYAHSVTVKPRIAKRSIRAVKKQAVG
ncbi:MAG: DUF2442 domain-containing protein [Nitrospirota bacterium]